MKIISLPWILVVIILIFNFTCQEIAFRAHWLYFLLIISGVTVGPLLKSQLDTIVFPRLFTAVSVQSFKNYICLNNEQINFSIHWREMRSKGKVRFSPLLFIPQWPCWKESLRLTNPTAWWGVGGEGWGGGMMGRRRVLNCVPPSTDNSVLSCHRSSLWPPPTDWREKTNLGKQKHITLNVLNWFLTLKLRKWLIKIWFSDFF